jgi:hypothetical protein
VLKALKVGKTILVSLFYVVRVPEKGHFEVGLFYVTLGRVWGLDVQLLVKVLLLEPLE